MSITSFDNSSNHEQSGLNQRTLGSHTQQKPEKY